MMRACLAIFLLSISWSFGTPLYSKNSCAPYRMDATAVVAYIYDGDTVYFKNGNISYA